MSKVRIYGDTSGYIDVAAPATADNSTLDLSTVAKTDVSNTFNDDINLLWASDQFVGMPFQDGSQYKMGINCKSTQRELQLIAQSSDGFGVSGVTVHTGSTPTERMRVDSSGRVTMPNQPAFHAYHSVYTTVQSGIYVWNATRYNRGNCYSTSNGRFTAPVDGLYLMTVQMDFNGRTWNHFYLRRNGSGAGLNDDALITDGGMNQIAQTYIMELSANDYVEMYVSGDAYSDYTFFQGYLLG